MVYTWIFSGTRVHQFSTPITRGFDVVCLLGLELLRLVDFNTLSAKDDCSRFLGFLFKHQMRKLEGKISIKKCYTGKCFDTKCTNMSDFYPLEVVGRGSETHLQVGENLNYFCLAD